MQFNRWYENSFNNRAFSKLSILNKNIEYLAWKFNPYNNKFHFSEKHFNFMFT